MSDTRGTTSRFPYAIIFGLLGAVLGLPASYFFQPGLLRAFLSLPDYVQLVFQSVSEGHAANNDVASGILSTVWITMAVTAGLGLVLGLIIQAARRRA